MYTKIEITKIFNQVTSPDELEKVCNAFLYLIQTDVQLSINYSFREFIATQAQISFRRLENLEL
jgi:hypothetical protein